MEEDELIDMLIRLIKLITLNYLNLEHTNPIWNIYCDRPVHEG